MKKNNEHDRSAHWGGKVLFDAPFDRRASKYWSRFFRITSFPDLKVNKENVKHRTLTRFKENIKDINNERKKARTN